MKFKHTVNLVIDNFKTTYKLLTYRVIISILAWLAYYGIILLFIDSLNEVEQYVNLKDAFNATINALLDGDIDGMSQYLSQTIKYITPLMDYLATIPAKLTALLAGLLAVALISRFLQGLGHYTASALINDKMAMQAESRFAVTLIKNLGKSSLYNGIYAPLSLVYDCCCAVGLYFLFFRVLYILPVLMAVMLSVVFMILLIAVKMTFTNDWLPAMICGKMGVGKAMSYSFKRKSKDTLSVYVFYCFSCLLLFGVNVAAALCTIGAGLIATLPLSYIYLLCYQCANYYVNNDIKFFTDKRTIVRPEHEKETTREDFLRGE